jgi:hypothetical protein
MADETPTTAEDRAIDALTRILESAVAPDILQAQQLILQRLATTGDLFPSRIPPPRNITEVGGYLNLVTDDLVLSGQVLASALGVAGPHPVAGFTPSLPFLYLRSIPNDRPPGPAQASTPVSVQVRSDVADAFVTAVAALHRLGCQLPVLSTVRPLPPVAHGLPAPDDLLPFIGRVLELVPGAALIAPEDDPLAVGQDDGSGPQLVVARQLDDAAPDAGSVTEGPWSLWACDASSCTQTDVTGAYVPLAPVLNGAGWYQLDALTAPTSLAEPGGWHRWTNTTGLVAGVSTVGDELRLLYGPGELSASSLRERLDWVWDGSAFHAPTG